MYRATTPTHTFTLEIDTSTCAEVLVTYKQGKVMLEKHYEDGNVPSGMTLNGNKVIIKLTQEETNLFAHSTKADVQLRALTTSGDVLTTKIFRIDVNRVLNDEVLA